MFTVICHPEEEDISVFAPFSSEESAQAWIDTINVDDTNNCPNEHYIIEALDPVIWEKS